MLGQCHAPVARLAVFVFFGWNACRTTQCGDRVACNVGMLSGVWGDTFSLARRRNGSQTSGLVGGVLVVLCENWIVDASILFFCDLLHDRFVFL